MFNELIHIDQSWLLAINGAHCGVMDQVMWYISQAWVWIPLYVVLIGLLIWRFGWKWGLVYTVALVAAVGLSDWISSGVIKHLVCRPRPTHEPALEGLVHVVNGYVGGLYGFVSSHAANTMSLAVLFGLIWNKINHQAWWLLSYVVVNCYSRMYLGVHYPGDILGGLVVGTVMAFAVYGLLNLVWRVRKSHADGGDDRPCCS
ncbi:MAG: phosphatase PAP2 family protein [Paludibacteraceae bacterium]|nr:phosphatase PAP2 family protein [Paludibacteraceae bacterium]